MSVLALGLSRTRLCRWAEKKNCDIFPFFYWWCISFFYWWYISFFLLVIYFLRSRLVGRSLGGAWPFRQPQHTIGHFLCSVRLRKWSDLSSPIVLGRRMTCLQVPECPSAHPQKMKLDLIWCSILFWLVLCNVKNVRLQHCNKKDSFGKYHEMHQQFD